MALIVVTVAHLSVYIVPYKKYANSSNVAYITFILCLIASNIRITYDFFIDAFKCSFNCICGNLAGGYNV